MGIRTTHATATPDGIPDYLDEDDDGDGRTTQQSARTKSPTREPRGDDILPWLDIDADGDGALDVVENLEDGDSNTTAWPTTSSDIQGGDEDGDSIATASRPTARREDSDTTTFPSLDNDDDNDTSRRFDERVFNPPRSPKSLTSTPTATAFPIIWTMTTTAMAYRPATNVPWAATAIPT